MSALRHLAATLLLAACASQAQVTPDNPDWREAEVPPPPALQTQGLIALDVAPSELSYGVDPASVVVGADGIVRYVVLARSGSGAINAFYEGIRCATWEFKVYARQSKDGGWIPATNAAWRSLMDAPRSRHSIQVARDGACSGRVAKASARQIVQDLRSPANR